VWLVVGTGRYSGLGRMLDSLQGKQLGSQHCPPSSGTEELCLRPTRRSEETSLILLPSKHRRWVQVWSWIIVYDWCLRVAYVNVPYIVHRGHRGVLVPISTREASPVLRRSRRKLQVENSSPGSDQGSPPLWQRLNVSLLGWSLEYTCSHVFTFPAVC